MLSTINEGQKRMSTTYMFRNRQGIPTTFVTCPCPDRHYTVNDFTERVYNLRQI